MLHFTQHAHNVFYAHISLKFLIQILNTSYFNLHNLTFVEITVILKPVYYPNTITIEENTNMHALKVNTLSR